MYSVYIVRCIFHSESVQPPGEISSVTESFSASATLLLLQFVYSGAALDGIQSENMKGCHINTFMRMRYVYRLRAFCNLIGASG